MTDPKSPPEQEELRNKVRDADVVTVRDRAPDFGDPLVGIAMFYRLTMTVPGGEHVDAAGLSWVSVAATHRRRGILRTMITELFDQWDAEDQVFAILTASEATIYERFGFGPTCFADQVSIDLSHAQIRAAQPSNATVTYATPEEIARRVPELHARWTATRPGALSRQESWWTPILADRPTQRPTGTSGLHYLLHDDGYAAYRIDTSGPHGRGVVEEVVTLTDDAHTDLWRVLTNLDLMQNLTASIPADDPLPEKLTDLRAVAVTGHHDKMWLRILDVVQALGLRRYRADLDVVLEVTDDFRGRGGRFALSARNGGGIAVPTTEPANVHLDISTLSTIYHGARRATRLAAAGRITTDTPETLEALDVAFSTEVAPFSGTFF